MEVKGPVSVDTGAAEEGVPEADGERLAEAGALPGVDADAVGWVEAG